MGKNSKRIGLKMTLAEPDVAIITGDSMADAAQKVVKAVGK